MNNLAKAAIGLTSTGTVCTGGYFIWNGYSSNYMPENKTNLDNSETRNLVNASSTKYEAGTMGNIYGNRLLDPFDAHNENERKELYQKIIDDDKKENKEITSVIFNAASIQHAFLGELDNGTSSLNKTCKTYYAKEIEGSEESDTSKIQIGDDDGKSFGMLCSMGSPIMLNKDSSNYLADSIGKVKGDELLSTTGKDNEALGKEKNKEFFKLYESPTEGGFKELYETNKSGENENKLKEKCGEIYTIVPTSSSNNESITADAAVKYCSMKLII